MEHDRSQAGEASELQLLTVAEGWALIAAQTAALTAAIAAQSQESMSVRATVSSGLISHLSASVKSTLPSCLPFSLSTNGFSANSQPYIFVPVSTPPLPAPSVLNPPSGPLWVVPSIPKGHNSWKQAVKDWEVADPSWSLPVPLCQWTEADKKGGGNQYSKWCQCRLVAKEFIEQ